MFMNRGIKKMRHIYAIEYYSVIKMNEIVPFAKTWMDLETLSQSEVSQKENNKYHILALYMTSRKMVLMNIFAG